MKYFISLMITLIYLCQGMDWSPEDPSPIPQRELTQEQQNLWYGFNTGHYTLKELRNIDIFHLFPDIEKTFTWDHPLLELLRVVQEINITDVFLNHLEKKSMQNSSMHQFMLATYHLQQHKKTSKDSRFIIKHKHINHRKKYISFLTTAINNDFSPAIVKYAGACKNGLLPYIPKEHKNKDYVLDLYLNAANLGNVRALSKIGILYAKGFFGQESLEDNLKKSIWWLTKAAEENHLLSQEKMAAVCYEGLKFKNTTHYIFPPDHEKALYWFFRILPGEQGEPKNSIQTLIHKLIGINYDYKKYFFSDKFLKEHDSQIKNLHETIDFFLQAAGPQTELVQFKNALTSLINLRLHYGNDLTASALGFMLPADAIDINDELELTGEFLKVFKHNNYPVNALKKNKNSYYFIGKESIALFHLLTTSYSAIEIKIKDTLAQTHPADVSDHAANLQYLNGLNLLHLLENEGKIWLRLFSEEYSFLIDDEFEDDESEREESLSEKNNLMELEDISEDDEESSSEESDSMELEDTPEVRELSEEEEDPSFED